METNRKIRANKRWLICLNEIKEYFNNNNTKNCQAVFKDRGLHVSWTTFLLNTKILFKDEFGYYKWKEYSLPNKKIIDKYREWKDIKYTVPVVSQVKEKKFIESTKTAQPQQLKTFSLLWGLLTFNY